MIKVSRLADYAVVILSCMANDIDNLMSGAQLSKSSSLPEPTVAKVLKLLAKSNILSSVRGMSGGYKINGNTQDINIADIVFAVDGPIALTACVEGSDASCDYACHCPVKGRWDHVNDAIRSALEDVTLADMLSEKAPFMDTHEEIKNHEHI